MKNILLQDDVKLVEDKIKQFESSTGCELLLVMANSSDPYPGASWRFGVVSGFFISLVFSYFFEFHHAYLWPVTFLIITLFMTWVGHFDWAKKYALSDWEIERETSEKAMEYFHTLGTSKVQHQVTAMIMASVLEKSIIVMVDEKLKTKISQADLDELVLTMKTHFKQKNMGLGFAQSIQTLEEKILTSFSGRVTNISSSELKDTIIFV